MLFQLLCLACYILFSYGLGGVNVPPFAPRSTFPPPGCDGPVYCTSGSAATGYPVDTISRWVFANGAEFNRLYSEVVLYSTKPSGYFPKTVLGTEMCDYVEDYPVIHWAFTIPDGWLPVIQIPGYYQFFRLESCTSEICNGDCTLPRLGLAQYSCRTIDSRVRVLVWDGTKAVSALVLLPSCCKCVTESVPQNPPPICSGQCSPFDPDYEWCLKNCIPQSPSNPVPIPQFCDTCYLSIDISACWKSCIQRNPPTAFPVPTVPAPIPSGKYCYQCNPFGTDYEWCLKHCICQIPALTVPCGSCSFHDRCCKKYCDPIIPDVTLCSECEEDDPDYEWCKENCLDIPPNCYCSTFVYGSFCTTEEFACLTEIEKREFIRDGLVQGVCVEKHCGKFLGYNLKQYKSCVESYCGGFD